jgi:hypothetical protein
MVFLVFRSGSTAAVTFLALTIMTQAAASMPAAAQKQWKVLQRRPTSSTSAAVKTHSAPYDPRKRVDPSITEMRTYFKPVQKPVALPDMPEPSGAKYINGLERSDDKRGTTSIAQRYTTKSTPADVLNFYKNGLLAGKWKVESATSTSVQAEKGDKSVTIIIAPRSDLKMTCDFRISYTYKSR